MERRVYYTEEHMKLFNDEALKRRGFEFESARNLGVDKEGYFFIISGEKEFFASCKILKEATKEVKGAEKKKLLEKFDSMENDVAYGIGLL